MVYLGIDTVEHLAKLCRFSYSEEEKQSILQDLNSILAYADRLNELNTDDIEPLSSVIDGQEPLFLREDIEQAPLSKEEFFSIAPATIAGLIKVPTIIEE